MNLPLDLGTDLTCIQASLSSILKSNFTFYWYIGIILFYSQRLDQGLDRMQGFCWCGSASSLLQLGEASALAWLHSSLMEMHVAFNKHCLKQQSSSSQVFQRLMSMDYLTCVEVGAHTVTSFSQTCIKSLHQLASYFCEKLLALTCLFVLTSVILNSSSWNWEWDDTNADLEAD